MEEKLQAEEKKVLDGSDAFKLYDTYGFPVDLTKEILEEKGYTIDEEGFKKEMEAQRIRAREARETTNYMGADATVYDEIDPSVTSVFDGYDKLQLESQVAVLTTEKELTDSLMEGQRGTIFVEKTPFYATMGGQQGDTGVITTADGVFRVEEAIHLRGGKIGHVGVMVSGVIGKGDTEMCIRDRGWIDEERIICEMAVGTYRAGAQIYLTYFAKELARFMDEGRIG